MKNDKSNNDVSTKFWEQPLAELNESEWELLCDGCGRCCLKKLIDEERQTNYYTRVVCRYFNNSDSQCTRYSDRTRLVPECLNVKEINLGSINWMPDTCAYRLRFEDKPLYDWHPLITGSREEMEKAGISIADRSISEQHVHPEGYEEHIIRWVRA